MKNLIRKILKESYKDFTMKIGGICVITSDVEDKDLIGKTCTIIDTDEYNPQDPGYDDYGVLVKVDNWQLGHYGGDPKYRILCGRSCWWVPYASLRPYVDYEKTNAAFDKLYEQEEDPFEWAKESLKDTPSIEVGDVFYVVDNYSNKNRPFPSDYRPKNVRYVILITDIQEIRNHVFYVSKKLCDSYDFTYKKEDYQMNSPRCKEWHEDSGGSLNYKDVIELIDRKYWRRVD